MPMLLTQPFSPGDLDPGKVYREAKIVSFRASIEHALIEMTVEYGNTVDGKWEPGIGGHRNFTIMNKPAHIVDEVVVRAAVTDHTDMIAKMPTEGLSLYQSVAKELYGWLVSKGHVTGSVI